MKYTEYILPLMFLASLNRCIREDMSDRPDSCTLKFSYVGDGTTQILQDRVHKVNMYVFNSNGMLLLFHPIGEADVKKQSTELNLPVKDYQIVTVGNTYNTEVSGEQNLTTTQFYDGDRIHDEWVAGNDSLCYAYKEVSISDDAEQAEEKTDLASSHYEVHVEVIGVASEELITRAPIWSTPSMSGLSSMTNFSNNACGSIATYYPEAKNNAEKHIMLTRFNIMRYTDHEGVNPDLTNANGRNMAHINLADFLAASPVIDLTKHEALIPIRIEFKSIGAVITIPDWYIVDMEPEF